MLMATMSIGIDFEVVLSIPTSGSVLISGMSGLSILIGLVSVIAIHMLNVNVNGVDSPSPWANDGASILFDVIALTMAMLANDVFLPIVSMLLMTSEDVGL